METLHVYTRVSTSSQEDEGTSLDSQRESGERKAQELGMKCVIENEKSASSSTETLENRPIIQSVLDRIGKGEIKHLFVWNTDRLSRNETTFAIIRRELRDNDCLLHTPTGKQNLSSPMDNLVFGVMSEIAQYDNVIRTQRLKEGKTKRAIEGFWHGGTPPFGYDVVDKKLVENKKETKWLKKIYQWYGKGKTPVWIKRQLDGSIPTKRGKLIWCEGSVNSVLRNTHYVGYYDYKGIRVECPPLIDEKTSSPVLNRHKENAKTRGVSRYNNQKKNPYILKEFLFCGECGKRFGGRYTKSQDRFSYTCRDKPRRWKEDTNYKGDWDRSKGCQNNKSLELVTTENHVWDVVCEVVKYSTLERERFKKETLKQGKKTSQEKEKEITTHKRKVKSLDKDLARLDERIGKLEVDRVLKRLPKSQINRIERVLTKEVEKIKREKTNLLKILETTQDEQVWVDWYGTYIEDKEKMFEIKGVERLETIKRYIEKIEVNLDKEDGKHILKLHFTLPIVNDRLKWKNVSQKSEGYDIREGRHQKMLFLKKNVRLNPKDVKEVSY